MSKPVLSDYKDFEIPIVQFYGFLKTHFVHFIGYSLRKRSTVTIVKKKVIAPQQFFLQNQEPWYSLSFLRERNELTVTISIKKLEKDT